MPQGVRDALIVFRRQAVLAAVASATLTLYAQQPAAPSQSPATGLIIGRVVDGTTGSAVAGATVTIGGSAAPKTGSTVLVDSKGRFMFGGLPAGSFTLVAQKNGYLSGAYGRARPEGQAQSIQLTDGGKVTDATIRVWPWGSIDGRIVDEAGEPVSGAFLYALARTWVGGHPSLSTNYSASTDDRGVFHIGRLPPGEYVVCMMSRLVTYPIEFVEADAASRQGPSADRTARAAELAARGLDTMGTFPAYPSPRIGNFIVASALAPLTPLPAANERLAVFPVTFFSSAPTPETATPIVLSVGERRTGVELRVRLTPTLAISGTATGPMGPIASLGLRLQLGPSSQFSSRRLVEPAQTVTDSRGRFTFLGVPPGSYVIAAAMTTAPGEAASVEMPVTVGERDLADVALVLRPQPRVSGRVEFDGTSDRPAPPMLGMFLRLDPADGHFERQMFQIDDKGTIAPRSVLPGKYFVHLDTTLATNLTAQFGKWTLQSAMFDGRDVSDVPLAIETADVTGLVVTLTDHPTALTGTVRDPQGAIDAAATVLVFPAARAMWTDYGAAPRRLRSVRPDKNGAFVVTALPAGDYCAIAVKDDMVGDWQRPTFLEKAAAACTRVKTETGRSAAVDLVTKRW